MDSYNEITLGTNVGVTGCLDPLAREIQNVSIANQTVSLTDDASVLEVLFEATVLCDRCSAKAPLFSEEQTEENVDATSSNSTTTDESTDANTTAIETARQLNGGVRLLQSFNFESQQFFQKLIQLVIFETEELAEEGELPESFVQISKAKVITNDDEEEVLVTEIKYQRAESSGNGGSSGSSGGSGGSSGGNGGTDGSSNGGGSGGSNRGRATLEFAFVDDNGEIQKETVEITEENGAVQHLHQP
mmetsp:Transcript_9164/g.21843  ORF Transcript_9164/g.21843 Transcript_9164/m.21843 type:complete len:246 (+) Transcript_9164:306-1043(+)